MKKIIQGVGSIALYLAKAEIYQFRKKDFPKSLRNQYIMNWGTDALRYLDVEVICRGEKPVGGAAILVGNHMSYVDIPLICSRVPGLFVAKAELSRWPVVGRAGKFLDTIFVKRESSSSRFRTAQMITKKVRQENERLIIFPSGTTSISPEARWRQGVFKIAKSHGLPIQPFRLTYSPKREVAFVDKDLFLPHLYKLSRKKKIRATLEFAPVTQIENVAKDTETIRQWCNGLNA